jgi:hypothetical protein
MYYKKLIAGKTIIEFRNDWLGYETIMVNGHQVCRGSSIWGMNHYFSIIEEGKNIRYILTTKVNMNMQILLDLSRDGRLIHEDVLLNLGSKGRETNKRYILTCLFVC